MTEQNSPAREFSFDDHDEDPLEELARIVSGEKPKPQPQLEAWLREQAGNLPAAAADTGTGSASGGDLDFKLDIDLGEVVGDELSDNLDHDLENELMQELETGDLTAGFDEYSDEPAEPDFSASYEEAVASDGHLQGAAVAEESAGQVEADFDFDDMVSGAEFSGEDLSGESAAGEGDEASLEDQLMVELGLSGSAGASRSNSFLSGFEDESVAAEEAPAASDESGPEGDFDFADAETEVESYEEQALATYDEEQALSAYDDEDDQSIGEAGDFKDKFEAELAINRAAQALNIDARRSAGDDDDLADLGFDMSIWDTPPPIRRQLADPAAPAQSAVARRGGSLAPDEQELSSLNFDTAFEAEMAALQPQGRQPALPAQAPRAAPQSAHAPRQAAMVPAGRPQAPVPTAPAAMFSSEREIDDHFAAVFAEELGFDGPETVPPHQPQLRHQPAAQPAARSVAQHVAQPAAAPRRESQQIVASFDDQHPGRPTSGHPEPAMDDYGAYAQTDGGRYAEDYDDRYADEGDDGWPDERPRSGSRGFRLAGIALGLALVVGLGAVSYGFFKGSDTPGEPVVVRADKDPIKTKPEDPGGTTVANQDKAAYERVSGKFGEEARQEKLVSDVEKPVNLVSASPLPSGAPEQEVAATDAGKGDERLAPGEQETVTSPTALQPRRVRTVTVLRDGTIVQPTEGAATEQTASLATDSATVSIDGAVSTGAIAVPDPRPDTGAAPRPQRQAAPRQAAPVVLQPRAEASEQPTNGLPGVAFGQQPTVIPVPSTDTLTTQSVARVRQSGDPVALAPEARQEPAVQAASAEAGIPLNTELSEWVVQISSQRSPQDAQAAYRNLSNRFPTLLDGRQMGIQEADIPGKGTFYRVRIATQSKEDAADFCQRLQNAGGSCFVTR